MIKRILCFLLVTLLLVTSAEKSALAGGTIAQPFGVQGSNPSNPAGFGTVSCLVDDKGDAAFVITAAAAVYKGDPFFTGMTGSIAVSGAESAARTFFFDTRRGQGFDGFRFSNIPGGLVGKLVKNIGATTRPLVLRGFAFNRSRGYNPFATLDAPRGVTTGNRDIVFTCSRKSKDRERVYAPFPKVNISQATDSVRAFGSGAVALVEGFVSIIVTILSLGRTANP